MANEFIARNGFRSQNNSDITGSLSISGSLGVTGSILWNNTTDGYILTGPGISHYWNYLGYTNRGGFDAAGVTHYAYTGESIIQPSLSNYLVIRSIYDSLQFLAATGHRFYQNGSSATYGGGIVTGPTSYASAPAAQLEVQGVGSTSATNNVLFKNSSGTNLFKITDDGTVELSTGQLSFPVSSGTIYFGNFTQPSYNRVGFSIPGAAVMVVDYSNARAGFGGGTNLITSAPAGLVEIQGKADEIQLLVKGNSAQSNNVFEVQNSAGSQILTLTKGGVLNTAGGGTSDRRKKDNIIYLSEDASQTIEQLKPAKFEFKNNPGVTRHGFIAQDVLETKPDLVLGNGAEENGTYGLDYDGVLTLTVKSLQEALVRISHLEQEIQELKNK